MRGLELPGPEAVARLADGVRAVLETPGPRHAARRVAGEIATLPEVEAAPDVLEALAVDGRRVAA